MKNINKRSRKIVLIILGILILLILIVSIYKTNKTKLLDKDEFKNLCNNIETEAENFKSQDDFCKFITKWADSRKLTYSISNDGNIIFDQKAVSRKKKVSPTVVIVNYNYDNAKENRKSIATAAMIADKKLESGRKTVIFINNEKNDGSNYNNLNRDYFPQNSKIIYLDSGTYSYISPKSFMSANQTATIPIEYDSSNCDTALRIDVKGLKSDCVDTGINKAPNTISFLSNILTRLKSKSTICQIADIKIGNKGNMYPSSMSVTILLNSYSVESFTGYLDKVIKGFNKTYQDDDNPNCEYKYTILDDSKIPSLAYSKQTFDSLTTLLYTVDDGAKRFEEDNVIPDGYEENDICSIVSPVQLRSDNENMYLDIYSQAVNKDYLKDVLDDNITAAKISKCDITSNKIVPAFNNSNSKVLHTLQYTYFKVSNLYGKEISLSEDNDTYFTPMSYINEISQSKDIVHIKENDASASVVANMIICYIQTKGNFLSL